MRRRLGRSGIEVSALGMGTWSIGGPMNAQSGQPWGWGEVDDSVSILAVRTAVERGVTLFDTADVYGIGRSESILGHALGPLRQEVLIATKWGGGYDEQAGHMLPSLVGRRRNQFDLSVPRPDGLDAVEGHAEDLVGW